MIAPDDLTRDGFLGGALQIWQPRRGYRAATDPVILAAALHARAGQQVLELGCGVGVGALCLAHRTGASVTGVEVQAPYADLARRNAAEAGLPVEIVTADLEHLPDDLRQRTFDHVMMNPPWFAPGDGNPAQDEGREVANRERTPLATWVNVAAKRLRPGGWLTMIHRSTRLRDTLAALPPGLGSVTVLPLQGRAGQAPERFLLRAAKDRRAPFELAAPLCVHRDPTHDRDGEDFSDLMRAVLRDGAALPWP